MKTTADLIVINASELLTCAGPQTGVSGDALNAIEVIQDGGFVVKDRLILKTGKTDDILSQFCSQNIVDAKSCLVSPALIDPHTHLVHMGSREQELNNRATGSSMSGISTGGIRQTIQATSEASDIELINASIKSLNQMLLHGTGTVEGKTGYGSDMTQELRLLNVTAQLNSLHAVEIIPTFLGAHIPPMSARSEFIQDVIAAIPAAAKISEFCDIACDAVCFTFEESDLIAKAATENGMGLRIHANQASPWRGLELAAKWNAASADHGDYATMEELQALARSGVVLTLLPGANFHMLECISSINNGELHAATKTHFPKLTADILASGIVPSVGTNYNPGSSPCLSMQMMMQLLPRLFRLGFAASWYMATLNAAASLNRAHRIGSIEAGKEANFIIWNVERHGQVINNFGNNHVKDVWLQGELVVANQQLIRKVAE